MFYGVELNCRIQCCIELLLPLVVLYNTKYTNMFTHTGSVQYFKYTVQYCTIISFSVPNSDFLYRNIWYLTVQYFLVHYSKVQYCKVFSYIVLYSIVVYITCTG